MQVVRANAESMIHKSGTLASIENRVPDSGIWRDYRSNTFLFLFFDLVILQIHFLTLKTINLLLLL